MNNAFQRKRKFDKAGRCIEDEISVGAVVPSAIVTLIALLFGKAIVAIPTSLMDLFKR